MPEHFCRDCKHDGNNVCQFTGAAHITGIECPSFEPKEESEMNKSCGDCGQFDLHANGNCKVVGYGTRSINHACDRFEEKQPKKESEMTHETVDAEWVQDGVLGVKDTEPVAEEVAEVLAGAVIRTFDTGATRDTAQGKLDYVKALSPIVLRRYVQYLDKHRLQPDGSYRDFDNWKKGIPQETYRSSQGRHFFDDWLLSEGYATEDNHGPVTDIEDVLCAELFNIQGRLREILKARLTKVDRTAPVEGGY